MPDENTTKGSRLVQINLAVTILLALLAGWSKYQLDSTEKTLKVVESKVMERDSERKDAEQARIERESHEKKQLTIYDAVVKSLETNDQKRQKVATVLVTVMLEDPLRTELLTVLRESGTPDIKREAQQTLEKENTFRAEASIALSPRAGGGGASPNFNWENFDYDIFWCENSGARAKAIAEKIMAELKAEGAKGRLRTRLLPDSVNAKQGYQHSGFAVRYNSGEERQSEQLMRVGDKVLDAKGAFTSSLSAQPTPWYLSAFVCPTSS
jgi:hypothetical protein